MARTLHSERSRIRHYRSAAAGLLALAAAGSCAAAPASRDDVIVTFIHLNDLHAHLTPHLDVVPAGSPGQSASGTRIVERGGLARFATLIKRIRADNPHSVLMNIGDTFHGGVEAFYTNGNAVVAPVNALGIDVGVPGNWDFAYGPIVTRRRFTDLPVPRMMNIAQGPRERMRERMSDRMRGAVGAVTGDDGEESWEKIEQMMAPMGAVERPDYPNLAANVTLKFPPPRMGQTLLPPTLMKTVGGIEVGFIGITSDIVPRMHTMMAFGLDFLEGEGNYRDLIERHADELRDDGAKLVVVMSELGIHKDHRLADVIEPGSVDVFFSAHTHEAVFEPLTSTSGALVVEAGNDGYLGRMDVTVRNGRVSARRWQLLPVGSDIPEDAAVKKLVDQARAPFLARDVDMKPPMPMISQRLTRPIDTVVGRTHAPLDRHHALESTFNAAMSDVIRAEADTQVAMTPGFRFDAVVGGDPEGDPVAQGDVTVEDLYRFFPAPYEIAVAEVDGARLREVMEAGLSYVFSPDTFRHSGGWFEGYSGVKMVVDLARPDGQRIRELALHETGAPIADGTRVTIAGCKRPFDSSGVLCSYAGFSDVRPLINPATGSAWTPVDILAHALSNNALAATGRGRIVDQNRTPLWPAAPFVQPLEGVR